MAAILIATLGDHRCLVATEHAVSSSLETDNLKAERFMQLDASSRLSTAGDIAPS